VFPFLFPLSSTKGNTYLCKWQAGGLSITINISFSNHSINFFIVNMSITINISFSNHFINFFVS